MRWINHFRPRQIMPAGEFEQAFWHVEDGELHVWREPLVGWVLGDEWECYRWDCEGPSCIDRDAHKDFSREVKPMCFAENYVEFGNGTSNSFIFPSRLTEDELQKWAQTERAEDERGKALRAEHEAEARRVEREASSRGQD